KRADALDLKGDLKPDMASLTLSSLNFPKCASSNSPDMIIKLADKMQQNGIKPELEVFDLGMVNYAEYLISKGLLEPPYYFNIILGNIATAQAKMQHLGLIVSELPDNSIWSVGGIGVSQKNMNLLGIIAGDGVRIGIEDNIWFDDDKAVLTTNSLLIDRVVKMSELTGRQIATPHETRGLLVLSEFVIAVN
ncbi:MAG TPA: 3-keto-5-aminohexanoate cleavage protein, partial [Cyanobacteria bacterium UBA9579]|nr:3-keto-5-aminohexanoate cleavage protein [Cyanobacteria bacterium UBA9579]